MDDDPENERTKLILDRSIKIFIFKQDDLRSKNFFASYRWGKKKIGNKKVYRKNEWNVVL